MFNVINWIAFRWSINEAIKVKKRKKRKPIHSNVMPICHRFTEKQLKPNRKKKLSIRIDRTQIQILSENDENVYFQVHSNLVSHWKLKRTKVSNSFPESFIIHIIDFFFSSALQTTMICYSLTITSFRYDLEGRPVEWFTIQNGSWNHSNVETNWLHRQKPFNLIKVLDFGVTLTRMK